MLAVSTDPAHSLGDAFDLALGPEPRPVAPRLLAAEVAGAAAWRRWRDERRDAFVAIAERGTLLDAADLDSLLDLPLPGADELLGLLEVVRLAEEAGCREVVVDTAPTGHTLRLLASPGVLRRLAELLAAADERHRALAEAFGGGGGGPAEEVLARLEADAAALEELLRDPRRSTFTWVTTADAMAVAESADGLAALERQGVPVGEVVVNRLAAGSPACPRCREREAAEREALAELARLAPGAAFRLVPEQVEEPRTVEGLRRFAAALQQPPVAAEALTAAADGLPAPAVARPPAPAGGGPPPWLDAVLPPELALVFVGGKGGVGKTTCAAAFALHAAAARPHRPVRLLSVDPAHSLADALAVPLGDEARPVPGAPGFLTAREIDAAAAWRTLRARLEEGLAGVLSWGGERRGAAATVDRAVLARLLDAVPPGLDELVALAELAEAAAAPAAPGAPLHVVDTAPTGHALRLLELPALALAWDHALMAILLRYRELVGLGDAAEELLRFARRIKALRALLADPARCRFVLVARGGELPRRESERLADALERLGVTLGAVVVNGIAPGPADGCPPCAAEAERAVREAERLAALAAPAGREGCAMLLAPAELPPPRGVAPLLAWGRRWELREPPVP